MPITGTEGHDVLNNTAAGQTINLLGGDDDLNDTGSASIIDGGAGNDTVALTRTAAPFTMSFTDGAASNPAASDGTTLANVEFLDLTTGAGDDSLTFNNPTYRVYLNTWHAGGGTDTITVNYAGIGTPLWAMASGTGASFGVPTATPGTYSVFLNVYNTEIVNVTGGSGDDLLYGADFVENFIGGPGNDFMTTHGGDDYLEGGPGDDTLIGGNGVDTASYRNASGGVTVTLMSTTAQAVGGGEGTDILQEIENLIGSAYDDVLTGSSIANVLTGGDGKDTLNGGAGNDTLDGGANVDTAAFGGNSSAYTITQSSTGHFTVAGPDGTDTLTNVEYAKFDDQTIRLLPGLGTTVNWSADPYFYMAAIRDFDGNNLGGPGNWKLIGSADVNGDGRAEHILFNRAIGRWAEVGTEADGLTYFANNGWAGDTRVVGIYIDPLVANGMVVRGSDTDSQRRFQNDLTIDNIKSILGQADYDHNGLQEVYFSLTDGTAYLHAYMHADGNIQYANYQSKQQVIDYLTTNGVSSSTWSTWFPASQTAMETVSASAFAPTLAGTGATLAAAGGIG